MNFTVMNSLTVLSSTKLFYIFTHSKRKKKLVMCYFRKTMLCKVIEVFLKTLKTVETEIKLYWNVFQINIPPDRKVSVNNIKKLYVILCLFSFTL